MERMIRDIVCALVNKDPTMLASFFTEDCLYYDYCPSVNGMQNIYIFGRYGMELAFKRLFVSGDFEAAEPLVEDEKTASFFGAYGGPYVFARIHIEELEDNGRVRKAIVHPA